MKSRVRKILASTLSLVMTFSSFYISVMADTTTATVGDFSVTGDTTGYSYEDNLLTISGGGEYTIAMADGVTSTTTDMIKVTSDEDVVVTIDNIDITSEDKSNGSPFEIDSMGDVTVVLSGDNFLTVLETNNTNAGLQKTSTDNTLIITSIDGDRHYEGTLTATGGSNGAAIGSGSSQDCNNVIINGGTITAIGGSFAAGIGCGISLSSACSCSNITINGGIVTATGGSSSAGIGGGSNAAGSNITINGGIVIATGGSGGAGIGGGNKAAGSNITITAGEVTASSGLIGAGIGGGYKGEGNNITISGGIVTVTSGSGAGIGGGYSGSADSINISNGDILLYRSDDKYSYIGEGYNSSDTATNINITGGYFGTGDTTENTVYETAVSAGYVVEDNDDDVYLYQVVEDNNNGSDNPDTEADKKIVSIEVTQQPDKVNYVEGEEFDPSGMIVVATYDDGTLEEITDYSYSPDSITDLRGDVDCDGDIDEADAALVLRYISDIDDETSIDATAADCNDDGDIDVLDANWILRYIEMGYSYEDNYNNNTRVIIVTKDGLYDAVTVSVVEKVIESLSIAQQPNKTEYIAGETFDPTGMIITATYNDGTSDVITDYQIEPSGVLTSSDTAVTISKDGVSITVPITVALDDNTILSLVSELNGDVNRDGQVTNMDAMLLVKILDGIKTYGDNAEHTGDVDGDGSLTDDDITLINNYLNGVISLSDTALVNADIDGNGSVDETDVYLINAAVQCLWSIDTVYEANADANDDGDVNMLDVVWILNMYYKQTTVASITISNNPDKTEYIEGETFDPTGIVITVIYKDGTTEEITDGFTYSTAALTTDDTSFTISYGGCEAEIEITVAEKEIVSVVVITDPDKTEYAEGEEFDPSGMELEITYNDGTTEIISGDDITAADGELSVGDTTVTIIIDDEEYEVEVPITVVTTTEETSTETTTKKTSSGSGSSHRVTTTEAATEATTDSSNNDNNSDSNSDDNSNTGVFEDIVGHWAEDYINYLFENEIIKGISDSEFAPNASTKRGDFALVLYRMLSLDDGNGSVTFTDVDSDSYYAAAIAACAASDIFIGYGDGTFKPEQSLTREELFVIMAKLFAGTDYDFTSVDYLRLNDYIDCENISSWAMPYIAYLTDIGAVVGSNNYIYPKDKITRAEMATVIYSYLTK